MIHKYSFLLVLLLNAILFSCREDYYPTAQRADISQNWKFGKLDSDTLYEASVPGCVHLDLLANNMIEDPFYRDNEKNVQWIENEDWQYISSFKVQELLLKYPRIDLVFEGLDTYADIYLNNNMVLQADNMFRQWKVSVKQYLVEGDNELKVVFHSPVKINEEKSLSVPYKLPDARAWTRKAPYQFGWDWGPRLVTSGIWRPVYLFGWKEFHLMDVQVITDSINGNLAEMTTIVEVESADYKKLEFEIKVDGESVKNKKIELRPGNNLVKLSFDIEDPKLWWTTSQGEHYLYDLQIRAFDEIGNSDVLGDRFGIRKIEIIQAPDSIGKSFYFKLNGKPLFIKGANYIPQDNFPSRVKADQYQNLIEQAVTANMNMLRVWGGGIYEDDRFYDLCDEYGILVWQDFMFACTMYPGDSAFLDNVKNEAIDNVKRLRNHPCIALWCGNNEIDEGWHNWGWQKQLGYSSQDSSVIWKAYTDLFHDVIPNVVQNYDRQRFYWPSSPSIGWGHPESLREGDSHYWGVWWGEQPFEIYEEKVGRFMSEYGFQGFPDLSTIASVTEQEDRNLESEVMRSHQKHLRGMELIRMYMERDFKVPDNFSDYIIVSQLVQAEGIRKAIEAHRRAMPLCMGTLYWQLNDCWPVVSWSSIDYYQRPKALHYIVKRAYDEMLISFEQNENGVFVYLISDKDEAFNAVLQLELLDFTGEILWEKETNVNVLPLSSDIYEQYYPDSLTDKLNTVLNAELVGNNGETYSNNFYFSKPKDLSLPDPEISFTATEDNGDIFIKVKAENLARFVRLSANQEGSFDDNYFDLLPGEEKFVWFIPAARSETIPEISVISLWDLLP